MLIHTNRFVRRLCTDCHKAPRREWTEGLMVRRGMIRSVLLNNNCGEIQRTQE